MPREITNHGAILNAIKNIKAISGILAQHDGHFEHEIDLEVTVYGRNYNGKKVGPYVRLLTYDPGEEIIHEGDWGGNTFYFVAGGQPEVFVQTSGGELKVAELPTGAQFGEMSVLAGVPRSATVRAPLTAAVQIMEVQRPALRLLRKIPEFGGILDDTYRNHGRSVALQDIGAASQLNEGTVKQLQAVSEFKVYSKNHVLFRMGDPIKRVYVIKSGWIRLSPTAEANAETYEKAKHWNQVSGETYYGPSYCFGLEGITRDGTWPQSGVLLGRTEILEISLSRLRQHPELRDIIGQALGPIAVAPEATTKRLALPIASSQGELIDSGLVDGTNLLLMDMKLCVRCGNCSMACHQTHGRSRLLRRGIHITRPYKPKIGVSFQSLMTPSVCMHCQDPECLTGCPTGAISRGFGGQVEITHNTCIGCGDCATQCPYNSISMMPRKSQKAASFNIFQDLLRLTPEPLPPPVELSDDLVANKCNLCTGTKLNPPGAKTRAYSCEQNCPTGALFRVDPRTYFGEISQIEGQVFKSTTATGAKRTSHRDVAKQFMHVLGIGATLILAALTILGMRSFGLDKPIIGQWLDVRWLTGIVGLIGIVGVMAYPIRRRIYRRRAGPLRYWMAAHSYLGVIAGVVLLLHGGSQSGGALTTALMIAFDLVILTGIFGIFCYVVAPRMLTKIEGQPLLIEDLTARREELAEEIADINLKVSPQTQLLIARKVLPRFLSIGYLLRQYLKRESLDQLVDAARTDLKSVADPLSPGDRDGLLKTAELAATTRRIDALVYLHQTLKLWLAPHVLVTSLMLALLAVHIVQVVYFAAR